MTPMEMIRSIMPPPFAPLNSNEMATSIAGRYTSLPKDYLDFIQQYGPGSIKHTGGTFDILDLTQNRLESPLEILQIYELHCLDRSGLGPDHSLRVYPEQDGILPWGLDDTGLVCFWKTKGHCDEWTIVVDDNELIEFEFGFSEFIAGSLSRSLRNGKYLRCDSLSATTPITYITLNERTSR